MTDKSLNQPAAAVNALKACPFCGVRVLSALELTVSECLAKKGG